MTENIRQSRAAIRQMLRVILKTQKQLAEDIGAQAAEVRQWTTVRQVPEEHRKRIAAFYGAVWDDSGNVWQAGEQKRRKFTRKSFKSWRERLVELHKNSLGFPISLPLLKPNGETHDKYNIEKFLIGKSVDVLCRTMSAAEDRRGENNSPRLFAVVESFLYWSQGIVEDFKLADSKHLQDVHHVTKRSGIIERTSQKKYLPMLKSVTQENSMPPNIAAGFIIKKGSSRHNAHIEHLKTMAKKGDKAAIANLKQHPNESD
jgi:hypothetical protein